MSVTELVSAREYATNFISAEHDGWVDEHMGGHYYAATVGLWRPFHGYEYWLHTKTIGPVLNAANAAGNGPQLDPDIDFMLQDLRPEDELPIRIGIGHFYPNPEDLYDAHDGLAKEQMSKINERMGEHVIFNSRDFEIVSAVVDAAIVKKKKGDKAVVKHIDPFSKYAIHRMIGLDVFASFKSSSRAMYMNALLGLERLLENDAIHTRTGEVPRNLDEVMRSSTKYDSDVLQDHIREQWVNIYSQPYSPQLPTTLQVLPHYADNQQFFRERILLPADRGDINLASIIRQSRNFSRELTFPRNPRKARVA